MTYYELKKNYYNDDFTFLALATEADIKKLIKETDDDDILFHYENAKEELRILLAELI